MYRFYETENPTGVLKLEADRAKLKKEKQIKQEREKKNNQKTLAKKTEQIKFLRGKMQGIYIYI